MPSVVKMSRKHQIVIPKEAREALGLKPGDELLVEADGERVVLVPKPASYARALRGLHKELWEGIDAKEYVRRERAGWHKGKASR